LAFLDNTQEALNAYRRATELDPDNGEGWNQLGHLLQRVGKWQKAKIAYENVLQIGKCSQSIKLIAMSYGNLGMIHKKKGELNEALNMYQNSLNITEKSDDPELKAIASNQYGNIGIVFKEQGKYDEAIGMYKEGEKIDISLGKSREKNLALKYANEGIVYYKQEKCLLAIKMQRKSLRLHKKLQNKEGFIINYGNLGNIYQSAGKLDNAIEFFEKSLNFSIEIEDKERIATNYWNLGSVYEQKNYKIKAKLCYTQSIELFKEAGSPKAEKVQSLLDNLK
jgi:tetratricopeptide (TPR) repeat protein